RVWTRRSRDARAGAFAGRWETAFSRDGLGWNGTWDVGADGKFHLAMRSLDEGEIAAAAGRFRSVGPSGAVLTGTYQILGPTSVAIQYNELKARFTWTRK